ncbi:MAG: glycosyltransferase family 4 protein [Chloroflexi bacterium]|nr:glycosyltransferase family 4 protein [Chloroflexota bacterium]
MNILQVGTGFIPIPPPGWGGTEKTIHHLSTALAGLGHQVTVLDMPYPPRPETPYQVQEVAFWWKRNGNLLFHALRGLSYARAVLPTLRRMLGTHRYDVVHFHNQFSAALGIPVVHRHGIPAVFTIHNWVWSNPHLARSRLEHLRYFLERRSLALAREVVCDSATVAQNLERYLGIPAPKLTVVPNGVDPRLFDPGQVPASFRERYAPTPGAVVLNVARIIPYKNQLTLARAVPLVTQRVPGVRFLFVGPVGSPGYAAQVREAIRQAGVEGSALLVGEVSTEELVHFYAIADLFVLCSTAESQGMVVADAMAAGKAIVGSRIGALEEMLGKDAGVLADPEDPAQLAEAIVALLEAPARREQLGQAARRIARERYGWDSLAARTALVYQKAAGLPMRTA